MIAGAFDDGAGPGISYRETLARLARGKQLAAGRAIEAGIAHDNGVFRHELREPRVAQNELAAGHSLTHVVIGVAFEVQVQAPGIPDAKGLPDITRQPHHERCVVHAVVAPASGDLARNARANRAVVILDVVMPLSAGARLNRLPHIRHHALGKLALIKRRVRRLRAELRTIGGETRA